MHRKLRIEYPGAMYHVMSRGDRREDIFLDDVGEHHSGELRRESAEAKAERLISEELHRLGWEEADLVWRRKSDSANWPLRRDYVERPRCQSKRSLDAFT
jgi:hypothetical protein